GAQRPRGSRPRGRGRRDDHALAARQARRGGRVARAIPGLDRRPPFALGDRHALPLRARYGGARDRPRCDLGRPAERRSGAQVLLVIATTAIRFLLDTNALAEPLRPVPDRAFLAKLRRSGGQIATSATVWNEMVYGLERLPPSARRLAIERYLEDLES